MTAKPVLQALVLADHIYTDGRTGKHVIAGVFHSLLSNEFPATLGRTTFAYVSLTEIRGRAVFELQYRRLDTSEVLLTCPNLVVEAKGPLTTVEIVVELPKFPMPAPGAYSFDVIHAGELLGSLRIEAGEQKEPK